MNKDKNSQSSTSSELFQDHSRRYEANLYVYPVLSRRARGISIGINLNLDRVCNFGCVYCQIRKKQGKSPVCSEFLFSRLEAELERAIPFVASGKIFQIPPFSEVSPELRRFNDIALSGDGEPTLFPKFAEVVTFCADILKRHHLDSGDDPVKIVLITNSTLLHLDRVKQGLEVMDASNGEIWAKLDAGTEAYYRTVSRSKVPFERILDNLTETARTRPIVIQTLFMRLHGEAPPEAEIDAYIQRLAQILELGGRIKLVQLHSIARPPAETWVTPLEKSSLEAIAEKVRKKTALHVEVF